MRILIGHNQYRKPGGEDAVVETERRLLEDFGAATHLYQRSNAELDGYSMLGKIDYFWNLDWSRRTYDEVRQCIRDFKPDVAHFHNIFYAIGPAAYDACRDEGVPVVQSQHNFRLLCLNGLLFRDGQVCEDCISKTLMEGINNKCFQGSYPLSVRAAVYLKKHREKGTWQTKVDRFITASEFGRKKLVQAGIDKDRITVKPHFVYPDTDLTNSCPPTNAVYVGRLSAEKGVDTLLRAWRFVKDLPLKIIGNGPMLEPLKRYAQDSGLVNVEFCGYLSDEQYDENMRKAKVVIVPSQCYENFPRIVIEAFSYGVPVVASDLGSLSEIIEERNNGLLFHNGDAADLAEKIKWIQANEYEYSRMRQYTARRYKEEFGAQKNYDRLMDVYRQVCKEAEDSKREVVYG